MLTAARIKDASKRPFRTVTEARMASVAFPHPVCTRKLWEYRRSNGLIPANCVPVILTTFSPRGVNSHYLEVSIKLRSVARVSGIINPTLGSKKRKANQLNNTLSVERAMAYFGSLELAFRCGYDVDISPNDVDLVFQSLNFMSLRYASRKYLVNNQPVKLVYETVKLPDGLYLIKPLPAANMAQYATTCVADVLHTQLNEAAIAQLSTLTSEINNNDINTRIEAIAAKLQGMGIPSEIALATANDLISAGSAYYRPVIARVEELEEGEDAE